MQPEAPTYSNRVCVVGQRKSKPNDPLEEEGIYYHFFKYEETKHTLVLADSVTAHETVAGYDSLFPERAKGRWPRGAFGSRR